MSNGAILAPQLIKIDFAVLPETKCQGLFSSLWDFHVKSVHVHLSSFIPPSFCFTHKSANFKFVFP